ncbi:hypothetical protein [Paracoccus sp. T5]
METINAAISFVQNNLLAAYGAAVGTVALILNFMRYKHTLSNSKINLRLEIIEKMTEDDFIKFLDDNKDNGYSSAVTWAITHTLKIRNIGNVTAHIENAWFATDKQPEIKAVKRSNTRDLIYVPISDLGGNLEVKPRSSVSLSIFSHEADGFIKPKAAYATDETGKKWKVKI